MAKDTILKKMSELLGRDFALCEDFPQLSAQEVRKLQANPAVLDEIYCELRQALPEKLRKDASAESLPLKFGSVRPVRESDVLSSLQPPPVTPLATRPLSGRPLFTEPSEEQQKLHRDWFVVDATDKVLDRLAAEIARRLRGKHKAVYTPHADTGDYVVVVNVEKLRITGNNVRDEKYNRRTGYPGPTIYQPHFTKLYQRFPGRILEKAVKGMLPKGPLGYAMLKKMKCYEGDTTPYGRMVLESLPFGDGQDIVNLEPEQEFKRLKKIPSTSTSLFKRGKTTARKYR